MVAGLVNIRLGASVALSSSIAVSVFFLRGRCIQLKRRQSSHQISRPVPYLGRAEVIFLPVCYFNFPVPFWRDNVAKWTFIIKLNKI